MELNEYEVVIRSDMTRTYWVSAQTAEAAESVGLERYSRMVDAAEVNEEIVNVEVKST